MVRQETNNWQQENKQNTIQLALWTLFWLLATALVAFGPKFIWDYQTTYTILAVVLHIGVGIKLVVVARKQIFALDELMQKIQLHAMALSLGVGLIVGTTYEMLEDIRLISFEPEISHLIIIMTFAYMTGLLLGRRKYL